MKVYAFDVDETLEISNGPVFLSDIMALKQADGVCVGLCGNWGKFFALVHRWQDYISFFNGFIDKKEYMKLLREHSGPYMGATEFVMVGNQKGRTNSLGFVTESADSAAAAYAGWRFILEDDFAKGMR